MPKIISESDFKKIISFIVEHPEGVKADEIKRQIDFDFSLRTLQRRLEKLIAERKIRHKGDGRSILYLPINKSISKIPESKDSVTKSNSIPVSEEGEEVLSLISSPLVERKPVGYNKDFLNSYIPNSTSYLSDSIMKKLADMGEVGIKNLPAGTYIRQIMNRLLIDLSWNSSRLEGNTYSLLDTQRLIEAGESAEGKGIEETQMILNHKAAIELLADQASEIGFNSYTIRNLHALLSDNLLADPSACGRLRLRGVGINKSVFHPLAVPQQIETCFLEILEKAEAIKNPFEQSFFVMVHLPYLQPFEDANKRVSRLAGNIPLIKKNLCPLSFIDVPQEIYINALLGVYELNRVELFRDVFIWAYKRSTQHYSAVQQSLGEPDEFRLRYRKQIGDFVKTVVIKKMGKSMASQWINKEAGKNIPITDNAKFIEVVETELLSLHEGNIARYGLRPSEFEQWQVGWN